MDQPAFQASYEHYDAREAPRSSQPGSIGPFDITRQTATLTNDQYPSGTSHGYHDVPSPNTYQAQAHIFAAQTLSEHYSSLFPAAPPSLEQADAFSADIYSAPSYPHPSDGSSSYTDIPMASSPHVEKPLHSLVVQLQERVDAMGTVVQQQASYVRSLEFSSLGKVMGTTDDQRTILQKMQHEYTQLKDSFRHYSCSPELNQWQIRNLQALTDTGKTLGQLQNENALRTTGKTKFQLENEKYIERFDMTKFQLENLRSIQKSHMTKYQADNERSIQKTGKSVYHRLNERYSRKFDKTKAQLQSERSIDRTGRTRAQNANYGVKDFRRFFREHKGITVLSTKTNTYKKVVETAQQTGELSDHAKARTVEQWRAKARHWRDDPQGYVTTDDEG